MDMMKMLGQLQESQQRVENLKKKLSQESLEEKTGDELLSVEVYKNGRLKDIKIDDELLEDKEQLTDYIILTLNKALEKAQKEFDSQLEAEAKKGLPRIPGMGF